MAQASEEKVRAPPQTAKPAPPIPIVKLPTVSKLALYPALPPQPLMSQFDAGFIASPSDRGALQRDWERASRAYNRAPNPSRSYLEPDDIRHLEGVNPSDLSRTLERVRLYPPFDSHPTSLVAVRVAKLVTPQLTVSLPRARRRAEILGHASDAELFDVSFAPSGAPEPINHQILGQAPNQGATMFTSYDEDVRPHPPMFRDLRLEERDPLSQVLPSLSIPVGGGIPFIMGYRIELSQGLERVILANGVHRAFRVAEAGCEWLPLALCALAPLELPPQIVELPNQMIASPMANPPLLTDFLDPDVALHLEYHPVMKVVRVIWQVEQYATVLR
jgi:hypothetical protein